MPAPAAVAPVRAGSHGAQSHGLSGQPLPHSGALRAAGQVAPAVPAGEPLHAACCMLCVSAACRTSLSTQSTQLIKHVGARGEG